MGQPRNQRGSLNIYADKWKWKHYSPKSLKSSKSCCKREDYSNTNLPQEARGPQINNLHLHLKELEKEQKRKPKTSERKEMIKIRAEINDIETKNKNKINKLKQ